MIPKRAPKKGKSKYFAKKTEYDGIVFDSKLEAARYKILKGYQEAGEITDLEVQVDFPCVITVEGEDKKICSYVADFRYKRDGKVVVEDTKGHHHSGIHPQEEACRSPLPWPQDTDHQRPTSGPRTASCAHQRSQGSCQGTHASRSHPSSSSQLQSLP